MSAEFALDKRRVRRNFARAAAGYDAVAVLSREVCSRMLERLDLVRLTPEHILDTGSGTGLVARSRAAHACTSHKWTSRCPVGVEHRAGSYLTLRLLGPGARAAVCADFSACPSAPRQSIGGVEPAALDQRAGGGVD
jgi:malonyl-CoA O-methyltransferase